MSEDGSMKEIKIRYPFSIFFIIGNEFCERFNYYGMRTILSLYLNRELGYDTDTSTVFFHFFTMMVYFMCIPGALIADSWLGKFRTIFYLSLVYVVGNLLIAIGAIHTLHLRAVEMTLIGLILIAIGSGGIKPCVAAFGGDQFILPEQVKQMATFFSLFYFSINSGSLISTTITPILRENVHCFGENTCYPLAFGVPAVLMATSILIFVLGKKLYKTKPPPGNMVVMVSKTICTAVRTRVAKKESNPREHWLDYAHPEYDQGFIDDIKVLLRVLVLYIPLPIFWTLFDQQGSRWTFQATRMDGSLGSSVEIQPDQLQMINPLLILAFIPLYEYALYPLLSKIGIRRPLQKLTCGGILAGVAFIISGCVELQLEKTYPVLPSVGNSQLQLFNGIGTCDYSIKTDIPNYETFKIPTLKYFEAKDIDVSKKVDFSFGFSASQEGCPLFKNSIIHLESEKAISYFLYNKSNEAKLLRYEAYIDKPKRGLPEVQILANLIKEDYVTFNYNGDVAYKELSNFNNLTEVYSASFDIFVGNKKVLNNVALHNGGIYTIMIVEISNQEFKGEVFVITEPNSLHMLWLVPQYVVMTLAEVMFSVTGLEFSYSEAPSSMKSVLQACWLLTVAIGNFIVILVAEAKIFKSQAHEFFLFSGLMFLDMIFFAFLAVKYKSSNRNKDCDENDDNDNSSCNDSNNGNEDVKKIQNS